MARILLIEDDFALRKMIHRTLANFGHVVIEASNGMEGLQLFSQINADLVITDLMMPKRDGFEVLLELRKRQPTVKVLVMSGGVTGEVASRLEIADHFGAAKVLMKPFQMIQLFAAVDDLLKQSGT